MKTARWTVVPVLCSLLLLGAGHAGAQERYALLVAGGDFAPGSPFGKATLLAPPNDVRLLASVLSWRFGFAPGHIAVAGALPSRVGLAVDCISPHASRSAVLQGFAWLTRRARPGDYVVFYFSGHGTRVFDASGTKATLENDALVTYDGTRRTLILDDELTAWLRRLRSRHVTVILDTCFSGGMIGTPMGTAGAAEIPATIVSKHIDVDLSSDGGAMTSAAAPTLRQPARHVPFAVYAACGIGEETHEIRYEPRSNLSRLAVSDFTQALYQALCWQTGPLNHRALMRSVVRHMAAIHRRVGRPGLEQTPQLQGREDDVPAPVASAWNARPPRVPLHGWVGSFAHLPVGYLGGVRDGMRFRQEEGRYRRSGAHPQALSVAHTDWFDAQLRTARRLTSLPDYVTCLAPPW